MGKFGADARYQRYSFLGEITEEQLHTYTPLQLGRILWQRDNVARAIHEERHRPRPNQAAQKYPNHNKPWIPDKLWECQFKVCHDCHRLGSEKSWVSLNGVLNGEIAPHVATGYSFSALNFRLVADVDVVKDIGYHAVPLVRLSSSPVLVVYTDLW